MPDDHLSHHHGERLVVRSPVDLLAFAAYTLGFHPATSVVAIGFDGPAGSVVLRADLPDTTDRAPLNDLAHAMARALARNRFHAAHLIGYGPDERVLPAVSALDAALNDSGIGVGEILRAHDGRWWSYTSPVPGPNISDGLPYDLTTSMVAAVATYHGLVALDGRHTLQARVAPIAGPAREAMRSATAGAELRAATLTHGTTSAYARSALLAAEATPLLDALLTRARADGSTASDADLAYLSVLLSDMRVRDEAWIRVDTDHPAADVAFWLDVFRRADPAYSPAPGCLLTYAALQHGDGALANVALERVRRQAPTYSMAALLTDFLRNGFPPSVAKFTFTPDELAQAWKQAEDHDKGQHP